MGRLSILVSAAALTVTWMTVGVFTAGSAVAAVCPSSVGAYSSRVLADGPLAYYRLDEPSGSTLCDSSVSAQNGTYAISGVSYGVSGAVPGDAAVAVASPSAGIGTGAASTAALGAGGGVSLTGNHSFTLEGWFRRTTVTQNQILVDIGAAGTGRIAGLATWTGGAGASSVGLDLYNAANAWPTNVAGVNLWDGRWHDLAVAYDSVSGDVTGYVDGASLGTQKIGAAINLAPGTIRVGYWVDTFVNQPFIGDAAEIAVYPTALRAAHVAAHAATPVLGRSASTSLVSGHVLVELPGAKRFVALAATRSIPFGSTVRATAGTVRVTTATTTGGAQSADFYDGQFRLMQTPAGAATLNLNAPLACAAAATAARRKAGHSRSLWGSGHGSFTTAGKYAAATELGTTWLTTDSCTGTRITVTAGAVRVRDLVRRVTLTVRAPHSYLAGR